MTGVVTVNDHRRTVDGDAVRSVIVRPPVRGVPLSDPVGTQSAANGTRPTAQSALQGTREGRLRLVNAADARGGHVCASLVVVVAQVAGLASGVARRVQPKVVEVVRDVVSRVGKEVLEQVGGETVRRVGGKAQQPRELEELVPDDGERVRAFRPGGDTVGRLGGVHEHAFRNAALSPEEKDETLVVRTLAFETDFSSPSVANAPLTQLKKKEK